LGKGSDFKIIKSEVPELKPKTFKEPLDTGKGHYAEIRRRADYSYGASRTL
jgi:hypothetical protein